jgi:hypothetical protein
MMWHVSLFQVSLAVMVLAISCIGIARRRREAREGLPILPASQGGSPLWLWVVIAVWMIVSLLAAAALLVTGYAVIDY